MQQCNNNAFVITRTGLQKESFDECRVFQRRASGRDSDFAPGNGFVTKGIWTPAGQV
jgi:hypothetical protein